VSEMKFGLQLEIGADQSRVPLRPRFEAFKKHVVAARESGFDGIFHGQWFVRTSTSLAQPIPALASVAELAAPMTIGTGILLLPLLHPIEVAEHAATLDVISNGRFILGVGAGYGDEFDHFEVNRKTRGKRLEESIELIKQLWGPGPVNFDGEHFKMSGVTPAVAPVQDPRPEIWLAASGDVAVRRAARIADACFIGPHVTAETVARQIQLFHEVRTEVGQPAPACMPIMREAFVAETHEAAMKMAKPYLERAYRELYMEHGQHKEMPPGEDDFDLPFEELTKDRFIVGDPDEARADVERYREMGVDYLVLHTPYFGLSDDDVENCIRLIGSEVISK
jgi:alkanesulfonate monooxygenase SsuD/methylene tetrahydromethanopterin reductase-like flavin-dependent oxidoreductase (luciferase family)